MYEEDRSGGNARKRWSVALLNKVGEGGSVQINSRCTLVDGVMKMSYDQLNSDQYIRTR